MEEIKKFKLVKGENCTLVIQDEEGYYAFGKATPMKGRVYTVKPLKKKLNKKLPHK